MYVLVVMETEPKQGYGRSSATQHPRPGSDGPTGTPGARAQHPWGLSTVFYTSRHCLKLSSISSMV